MTRFASHGNEKALLEHRTDAASLLASHIDEEEPDILLIRYGEILVPSLNLVGEAAAAICKLICPSEDSSRDIYCNRLAYFMKKPATNNAEQVSQTQLSDADELKTLLLAAGRTVRLNVTILYPSC